jgi:hypothetical protein
MGACIDTDGADSDLVLVLQGLAGHTLEKSMKWLAPN